jgi:NLPA lipoprotein
MRKGTLKKALALALTGAVLVGAFAGCGAKKDSGDKKETKKIVIGASPSPHADILKVAKKELKKEGYELEIKEYSDYVQPNTALESGDLDANYFQHKPYLDDFNKQKKTHLVSAGTIHYEPFGIFPGKTKALKALKNGATVAVSNDTTKRSKSIIIITGSGLIKLKDWAGLTATKKDIVENKKTWRSKKSKQLRFQDL